MEDFLLILANMASMIGIAALWGISANSPFYIKLGLSIVALTIGVLSVLWRHKKKYRVKGYSLKKDAPGTVDNLLIQKTKRLRIDTLVSIYKKDDFDIELVAIGYVTENEDEKDGLLQIHIEHSINDGLLNKIIKNEKMKKCYFVKDTVRFADIQDLLK